MILTCPECSTRYLVDARAIGASGRTVRCANCGHSWRQEPDPAAELAELAPILGPERRVEPSFTPEAPPDFEPRRRESRVQLPVPARRRASPWAALRWFVVVAAVAGAAAGIVWARADIVGFWPYTARFYALAGLRVPLPGEGLKIEITTSWDVVNGLQTLLIKGEVKNVSPLTRSVPPIRVSLYDRDHRELQNWTERVASDRLLPGASVPFNTSVTSPNEATVSVGVEIAGSQG